MESFIATVKEVFQLNSPDKDTNKNRFDDRKKPYRYRYIRDLFVGM